MKLPTVVRQKQNLPLTMIHSAEILQMSAQELDRYVERLALENPIVDLEERIEPADKQEDIRRKLEWLENMDNQNRVYYRQDYGEEMDRDIRNVVDRSQGENLTEYLNSQLLTLKLSRKDTLVINYMIESLDSNGYLEEPLEEIEALFGISKNKSAELLNLLQGLEPAGVGAANLKECLLLQLQRRKENCNTAQEIVSDYLELVAKNRLPQIAKKLKVSLDEVLSAVEEIHSLNPKPGCKFSSKENLNYIVPDVTVVKLREYFEIILNEYRYPVISVNHYYRSILLTDCEQQIKGYVGEKIKQAEWVRECIVQRNVTIINVAKCMVEVQRDFFSSGKGLKPLRMMDLAQKMNVHESTISRAVRDKYLQCTWGIFPLNYFFSGGVKVEMTGRKVTAREVQAIIKEIIHKEDKKKPFSDQKIMEKLSEQGIGISRRTVAKYRDIMGMRDAGGRKIYK